MLIRQFFQVIVFICLLAAFAIAGTTGKVTGQITDNQSGEPLIGVNVQLVGTQFGTSTDDDGVYIILNVPPGLYTIAVDYIGYQSVRINDVRVNVDFTTRVDQGMTATVIEMDAVEVYGERNPLVRQDLTNTQVAVTSEQIESLPIDNISDIVALQAGIVRDNSGALHIRGGRSNEVAFQVNGMGINNPFGNSQGVGIATNAVEEVSVSAGTFSAEYGNALSGVINFVTKEGGPNYEFSLRGYTGDHYSSRDDIFFNIDDRDPFNNARAEWTLSGPVPLLGDKFTFFGSGVIRENNGHLYGQRIYNTDDLLFIDGDVVLVDPFGLSISQAPDGTVLYETDPATAGASGDGEIVPMVTSQSLNLSAKLAYQATNTLKLTYDFIMDDGEWFSSSSTVFRRYRFTPDGRPKTRSQNFSHSLGMTHTLSNTFFYTLKVGANLNAAQTSVYDDELDPRYIPAPGNDLGNLIIPPTGTYVAGGTHLGYTREEAQSLIAKLDFVNQISSSHELKFGAEAALHELDLNTYTMLLDEQSGKLIIPSADINEDFTGYQTYLREPVQGAFYVLDKMELAKRFILNAGLRYEYLDTRATYNPDLAGTVDSGVDDPDVFEEATPKHRLAPRISLSFPITSEGIIRFSYGTFYQNPTFRSIYTNPRFEDFDFIATPSFGNANLEPQKSIQYEIGLQQQFTEDLKIDLTIFYKDVTNLIQSRRVIAGEVAIDKEFNVITNISYANVRGFTAALLKRRAPRGLFSASLDYTYQIAEGAFDNPLDLAIDTRTGRETEQEYIPLDFDRTHVLNGTISLTRDSNWQMSAIGSIQTGTPYTPSVPSSIQPIEFENNSGRRPILMNVDLRLAKFFLVNDMRFSVFMQVENVFDRINERFIHSNTGRSLTNLNETINPNLFNNLRETIAASPEDYFPLEFLDEFYQREDYLSPPREIRMGIEFDF